MITCIFEVFSIIFELTYVLGTTSSSNTVVAGQENLQETDENKMVRESEDRCVLMYFMYQYS